MAKNPTDAFADALSYATDAGQRLVLFLEALRQRGLQYEDHQSQLAPHVLDYQAELVCDGRQLGRPVNYMLARIKPPHGLAIDATKRPFVIVDPRAGHGPGIGGFKADSEIGVAMKAGHPCYFVGFLPDAVPGQTIEDIALAEAVFLETVIARHPDADGKPCVVGNCQAGWAVMILAALRPELLGPIVLAGSPLSYWAGVRGQNPMRYSGGLLGGSWLTALASDLGAGTFDGAWLVQNFENQNPANTFWSKQYNLYSKIDTEVDRYLGFEKWWGGHVTLNAEEIQFIVDELFIGNRLACGEIKTSDGTAIDLRNIRSPIVVFCSKGDNITPPQQALDWILDLYDSVDEIRSHGQTIVYAIHDTIGHLGIFVSAGVARKEHDEFASNIDFIDVLPPGLYEAVFEPKVGVEVNPDLVTGEWVMRCEARTLDDIRALGGNDLDDERRFETAARVSKINLSLYRALVQPWIQATANPSMARAMRAMHPLRLQYEMFGSRNPFLSWLDTAAPQARQERHKAAEDNIFLKAQEAASSHIVNVLDSWRHTIERASEQTFLSVYGSPLLQSAVGVDRSSSRRPRGAAKSKLHAQLLAKRIEELRAGMASGDLLHACMRALLYIGMARESADERSFEAIRRLRKQGASAQRLTLSAFKSLTREQFFMLLIDQAEALRTLPDLLPPEPQERADAFKIIEQVATARGPLSGEAAERLDEIRRLFTPASPMGSTLPASRIAPPDGEPRDASERRQHRG